MIEIKIDEQACVGCTLCVDKCPTKVFEFDETKAVPRVVKPGECFGCLSCSEICPATAIRHEGVTHSENHYYDPGAVEMAARIASDPTAVNFPSDAASRGRAIEDLGVRLLSVASIFRQTLGDSLPAAGTMAGRTLATQLPRYQTPKDFAEALSIVSGTLAPAWELSPAYDGAENLKLTIKGCFIRDLCRSGKIELGGDLCVLFQNYLTGYLAKIAGTRLKLESAVPGDKACVYTMKVFQKA
jgi:L-aspartate semialdehyde sulfurtransferase ferredoxin